MKILCVTSGAYGQRIVENLCKHSPAHWSVADWRAPTSFPIVLDEPLDWLPEQFDAANLILALGEHPAVAELIPEICKMTGAKAVIAPIDRSEWLPKGLANQLRAWLAEIGVASVFPKPFCSLTDTTYSLRGQRVEYKNPIMAEWASYLGKPRFRIDTRDGMLTQIEIERGSPCGCSVFVANGLHSVDLDSAEFEAGMLHHHYPCLASMGIDPDYGDTLMHVSGNLTCDAVSSALNPHRQATYLKPR